MNARSAASTRRAPSFMEIRTSDACLCVDLGIVHRVETLLEWIRVPRAPHGVVGIGEIRGRPTTLIATEALAGKAGSKRKPVAVQEREARPRHVLLFGEPFGNLALLLPEGAQVQPLRVAPAQAVIVDRSRLRRFLGGLRGAKHGMSGDGAP